MIFGVVLLAMLMGHARVQEENMALHLAAKHGHTEVLQKILETGENTSERNIVRKQLCQHARSLD